MSADFSPAGFVHYNLTAFSGIYMSQLFGSILIMIDFLCLLVFAVVPISRLLHVWRTLRFTSDEKPQYLSFINYLTINSYMVRSIQTITVEERSPDCDSHYARLSSFLLLMVSSSSFVPALVMAVPLFVFIFAGLLTSW